MTQATDSAASTLLRLANGYQISQALYVAAELKVADLVGDTPVPAEDIAPRVGAHSGSLYRLLRTLSTVGVFRETDDRRFVATPMSDLLRTDHPCSLRARPALLGRPYPWQNWGDLLHCVRTGQESPYRARGAFLDLAAKACPRRVEATFFALLMSVFNGGTQSAQVAGGYLYDWLGYTMLVLISAAFTALAWVLVPLVQIDRIEMRARAIAAEVTG
jgi:hypothetical protein